MLKIEVNNKAESAAIEIDGPIGSHWDGITAKDFTNELNKLGQVKSIDLNIRSEGGDVFEGFTMYERLVEHPAKVNARIYGIAGSIASVIAMAADHLKIADTGFFMVHRASTFGFGNAGALGKVVKVLDKMDDNLIKAYQRKTGLEDSVLRAFIEGPKDEDGTWFTGKEAFDHGFVDELVEEAPVTAHIDLRVLGDKCPAHVKEWVASCNAEHAERESKRNERTRLLEALRSTLNNSQE